MMTIPTNRNASYTVANDFSVSPPSVSIQRLKTISTWPFGWTNNKSRDAIIYGDFTHTVILPNATGPLNFEAIKDYTYTHIYGSAFNSM